MEILLRLCLLVLIVNTCYAKFNVIELNYDLGPDTPYFQLNETEPFKYDEVEAGYSHGYWLALGKYRAFEHMTTHIDAPYTFNSYGYRVDQIPTDQFFGQAVVIDVRDKVAATDNYLITVDDIKEWVSANGVFPNECIILFNTGWGNGRYPDAVKFYGDNEVSEPGITLEAIKEIMSYEQSHGITITAFGGDVSTLDLGISPFYPVSTYLASLNKYYISIMTNLESLPATGATIMVAPLKLRGGTAAQARVFARLPYRK